MTETYKLTDLYTTSAGVDCGALVLTFLNAADDTALDGAVFTEDRSTENY